jgi:hypothetical protein
MTPMRIGMRGNARFFAMSNKPSAASRALSSSNARCSAPAPASSSDSTMSWNSPRASYRLTRARASTRMPSPGLKRSQVLFGRNIAQRTCAPPSLSVKYRCPDAGREKFEISPSTQISGNTSSSRSRTKRVSAVGV